MRKKKKQPVNYFTKEEEKEVYDLFILNISRKTIMRKYKLTFQQFSDIIKHGIERENDEKEKSQKPTP
ncbi:MAG: hypothetical protein HY063_03415 [Bacteroidetes bacterium]|nr:hypothetical protein [Bacteroidota bacterium]